MRKKETRTAERRLASTSLRDISPLIQPADGKSRSALPRKNDLQVTHEAARVHLLQLQVVPLKIADA
jgi:hypothetical protein